MMEVMFKTRSETSEEKRDNFICGFWQMNFIDKVEKFKHVEICVADKIKDPEEDSNAQKDFSCSYCQNKFRTNADMIKHFEEH